MLTDLIKSTASTEALGLGLDAPPGSSSSRLTPEILDECKAMLAAAKPVPHGDQFVSPRVWDALKAEFDEAPRGSITQMLGLPVFVMESQKADCWIIPNKEVADAYRKGMISEELLARIFAESEKPSSETNAKDVAAAGEDSQPHQTACSPSPRSAC